MFEPSNMLLKYMDAHPRDLYDIIGALMGYINADPYFRTNDFEEAVRYVLSHGVTERELFDDFDPGLEYAEDSSSWDDEYYSYATAYLKDNFCKKRIEHVKAVAQKLHPISKSNQIASIYSETPVRKTDQNKKEEIKQDYMNKGQKKSPKKVRDQQDEEKKPLITQRDAIMRSMLVFIILVMLVIGIVFIIKNIGN